MAIVQKIPHEARFIPTNNTFAAAFGTPTVGYYDFGIAANSGQNVIALQPSTYYYVDYFQIAGNIPSETFLSVISTQPVLEFKRRLDGHIMFTAGIPISAFSAQIYISAFFYSQKKDDYLTATFSGILAQNFDLVGVSPININMKLAVYAMDEKIYGKEFLKRSV
jgi:hypothetical protein